MLHPHPHSHLVSASTKSSNATYQIIDTFQNPSWSNTILLAEWEEGFHLMLDNLAKDSSDMNVVSPVVHSTADLEHRNLPLSLQLRSEALYPV